jgi:hypothetical protein
MAANPKAQCRLDPIIRAYLRDLSKVGAYGRGESGVMRRLIENGVREALERGIISKRSTDDFAGADEPEDKEED